jgi:hypothetical protein
MIPMDEVTAIRPAPRIAVAVASIVLASIVLIVLKLAGISGEELLVLVAAAVLAVIVRELLRHYSRRLAEDRDRIKSATHALKYEERDLRDLLQNSHVPSLAKEFLLEISGLIVDRSCARPVADWVQTAPPVDKTGGKFDGLIPFLDLLRIAEPRLFEKIVGTIRGMIITFMLQWRETRHHHDKVSHLLATYNSAQSIDFAIAVWTVARAQKH